MSGELDSLAARIAAALDRAVRGKGRAVLAVCGGSSPLALFAALRDQEIAWPQVCVTLVDDRQVPPDHEDSNIKLIRAHLLTGRAAAAEFIPLAADQEPLQPDVTLLGIGPDGHFASLFGDMTGLAQAFSKTASPQIFETGPKGAPRHPRITMNLASLLASDWILLLVNGAEKQAVLEAAATDASLPVHHLLKAGHPHLEIVRS